MRVYAINRSESNQDGQLADPRQLAFLARHFRDLQTIRFAPIPLTMILIAIMHGGQNPGHREAWTGLILFLVIAISFYAWSTNAIKRKYGTVRATREETARMRSHPVILLLQLAFAAVLTWSYFFQRGEFSDVYIAS